MTQLSDYFEIKCKNCNSTNVTIKYYSGMIFDGGGCVGSLYITCNDCGNEVDGDDINRPSGL